MSFTYQQEEQPRPDEPVNEEFTEAYEPTPIYTTVLVVAILGVAAVQFVTGLELSIMAAGFDKPAFLVGHEYWRILTGATVHGGVMHVGMNCYAFYSFGKIVEMLSNRAHLAIVFLLSAIGGGILSLVFVPDGLSVGASGGIVGLVSYLLVYAFRRRRFISAEFRKSLLINIGFIVIFGLVLFRVIDNFGHIGGLITGAVYGFVQIPSDEYTDPREAGPFVQTAGLAAMGIYLAGCLMSVLLILKVI
ncbi:MAG: rhomboid family intramembrane serine protease [Pyrinomonadaceae bacterium]|nr:rhomboid family intramembrane serine protease [Pyrinomonadaceae bacterium]